MLYCPNSVQGYHYPWLDPSDNPLETPIPLSTFFSSIHYSINIMTLRENDCDHVTRKTCPSEGSCHEQKRKHKETNPYHGPLLTLRLIHILPMSVCNFVHLASKPSGAKCWVVPSAAFDSLEAIATSNAPLCSGHRFRVLFSDRVLLVADLSGSRHRSRTLSFALH